MLRTGLAALLGLVFLFGALAPLPALASGRRGRSPAHLNATWILRGAVLPWPSEQRGHYEVGFFPTIGADGLPLGYPAVQEILPAGRSAFRLRIPVRITRGYLFAEYVEDSSGRRRWIVPTSNPWTPATAKPAELYLRVDGGAQHVAARAEARPFARVPTQATDTSRISSVSAAPLSALVEAADEVTIRGTVGTLFAPAGVSIPQDGVEVRVRGRREGTRTDPRGAFVLRLPKFLGRVPLEFLKDGYHPTVLIVNAADTRPLHVDIASRSAIDQLAQRLGIAQGSSLGVVLGRALTEGGAPLSGLTAQLSRQSVGPFYFDERGLPDRDLRATTSDGRFLFFNVQPGSAYLETEANGEIVAPLRVSTAEGGELLQRDIIPVNGTLSGRIYEAVKKGGPAPLVGARVRIEGMTEWTTSDSLGAFRLGPFKWSRGERVSLMFSAASFQNHRYQLSPGPVEHHLYAFPARYLETLAESHEVGIDPASGLVVGRATAGSVRIDALSEETGPNTTQDFYFDAHGRMRPAPAMTDPRFGTYMLFNVPSGHAYLLGHDGDGKLRFGKDIFTGPSVVNVEVEGER